MKYKRIKNNFIAVKITEPTELKDCDCAVINETDSPIWIRFINSRIKAKTNHPFMMDYFANCEHRFNIQILPNNN